MWSACRGGEARLVPVPYYLNSVTVLELVAVRLPLRVAVRQVHNLNRYVEQRLSESFEF